MVVIIKENSRTLGDHLSKPDKKMIIFELFDSFEEWYNSKSFIYLKKTIEDKVLDQLIAIKEHK